MSSVRRTALIIAALFCLAAQAAAAPAPVARIGRADGRVTVKYAAADDFVSVWRHEKVGSGDTVSTGPGGSAELQFPDGSLVVLGSGTTLAVETIEPGSITDEKTGDTRVVITARLRLTSGRMRAAVGTGSVVFFSAGWAKVFTDPATGADATVATDVFENGYYLRVTRGAVFVLLRDSRLMPVCGDSRVRVEMFGNGLAPLPAPDPSTDIIALPLTGTPPEIAQPEEAVANITINGKKTEGKDGTFRIAGDLTGADRTALVEGEVAQGWAALVSVDNGLSWVTVGADENGRWRYTVGPVPAEGYTLRAMTTYVGAPPPAIAAMAEEVLAPPAKEAPAPEKEEIDASDVASRFVDAFSAALSRGDTGALASLVSADYNGTAGGASRSALLRAVSEFFSAGGTLSVSAYAAGASLTDGSVIATMSFSSRANGTAKSGNLRLWLTSDGKLTHSEGEWVF